MMILDKKRYNWYKNIRLKIPYIFEGKKRNYIPDFIVNDKYILEVKGSNDKPELPFKFKSAKTYVHDNDMKFHVISYNTIRKHIDWNKVKNYHKNNK